MQKDYDTIIIGANIIGMTLACVLADSGLKIAILDKQIIAKPVTAGEYDLRVYAITRASQKILTVIGVWQDIVVARVSPYRKMFVWDKQGQGRISFDSRDLAEPNLGHIVEHRVIQAALLKKVQSFSNVSCISPVNLQALTKNANRNILQMDDGTQLSADLIIGADGAHSWLRQQSQIAHTERDYGHQAIVAVIKTKLSHERTAWQSFNGDNILAFLPLLEENKCSIVWSVSDASRLMEMSNEAFNCELSQVFRQHVGEVELMSERLCFPLKMRHAKQYVQSGIALIGDAVRTVHPLAGQGLNLGLLDSATLAEVVTKAYQSDRDYASLANLRKYERWRKGHNMLMITAMAALKRLFANDPPVIGRLRNEGLNLTHRLSPVKALLMRHAMGINGDLPVIAQ